MLTAMLIRRKPLPGLDTDLPTAQLADHQQVAELEGSPVTDERRWVEPSAESSSSDHLAGGQDQWWDFEPPKELALIEAGTPQEICRIVRESLERQLAIRALRARKRLPALMEDNTILRDPADDVSPISDASSELRTWKRASAISFAESSGSQQKRDDVESPTDTTFSSARQSKASFPSFGTLSHSTSISSNSSIQSGPRLIDNATPPKADDSSTAGTMTSPPSYTTLPAAPTRVKAAKSILISPRAARFVRGFLKSRTGEGECASCLDDMKNRKLIALECQHKYCSDCFSKLIVTALMDESYYPPRCCNFAVPAKTIQGHLKWTKKALYKLKSREYSVPAGDRLYCPYPTCAKWNPPSKMAVTFNFIRCKFCKGAICHTCKGQAHPKGNDCPKDSAMEATLRQAERSGWRRCYSCRAIVEKTSGCIHITCKCKAEFCYVCGLHWKTCACTEDDEYNRQETLQEEADEFNQEQIEIAEAIAAVERAEALEMERVIARAEQEERERQERQDMNAVQLIMNAQRERRRQNEILERARREQEEAQRRETERRRAIIVEMDQLRSAMAAVHRMQRQRLLHRHDAEASTRLNSASVTADGRPQPSLQSLVTQASALEAQHGTSLSRLRAAHADALREMASRHSLEERENAETLHLHFRNQPNGHAREEDAMANVRALQAESRALLIFKQRGEVERAELRFSRAVRGVREEIAMGREAASQGAEKEQGERKWFDVIVAERERMLEEVERGMLQGIGAAS